MNRLEIRYCSYYDLCNKKWDELVVFVKNRNLYTVLNRNAPDYLYSILLPLIYQTHQYNLSNYMDSCKPCYFAFGSRSLESVNKSCPRLYIMAV